MVLVRDWSRLVVRKSLYNRMKALVLVGANVLEGNEVMMIELTSLVRYTI